MELPFIKRFFAFRKQKRNKPGRVCLAITKTHLHFAYVVPTSDGGLPGLQSCKKVLLDTEKSLAANLDMVCQAEDLADVACSFLLLPDQHRLILTEVPNVPKEAQTEALRWQLRDLLDYPPTEAVLASFACPHRVSGEEKLWVSVLPQATLQNYVAPVKAAGFALDTVDIGALALGNALEVYAQGKVLTGLLSVTEKGALLLICQAGELAMVRQINVDLLALQSCDITEAGNGTVLEQLELSIRQSLDYFESQMRGGTLEQLTLHYAQDNQFELAQWLSQHLNLKASCLDFARLIQFVGEVDHEALCDNLAVIGGAMRGLHARD